MKKTALLITVILLLTSMPCFAAVPSGQEISDALAYADYSGEQGTSGSNLTLTAEQLSSATGDFTVTDKGLLVAEEGEISFAFPGESGAYSLLVEYDVIEGRSLDVELNIKINGSLPFREAAGISLKRRFEDKNGEISQDLNGNDIRPVQVETLFEKRGYLKSYLYDNAGFVTTPLKFELSGGATISIISSRETVIIHSLSFLSGQTVMSWQEYISQYQDVKDAQTSLPIIEAELPYYKTDSTLVARPDRTSSLTSPYKGSKISLNMIGGDNFTSPGQELCWSFTPEESGLYEIRMRVRQNYSKGFYSTRTLKINGEIPFREAENLTFMYNGQWVIYTLGGSTPLKMYFEKGQRYELSLSYTIGDFSEVLRKTEESITVLNDIYRELLMIMGSTPDSMRDYHLEKKIPDTLREMKKQSDNLYEIAAEIEGITKFSGSDLAPLRKTAEQLARFSDKPEEVSQRLRYFKDNIASLNTWKISAMARPLDIDYILIASPDSEKPKANAGFFENISYFFTMFFASFFEDYNSLSGTDSDLDVSLNVWSTQGRDQAQVFNDIIRSDYTINSKERFGKTVGINLQVVAPDAILPSTSAGNGPDILLHAGMQLPINYATRNAVTDIYSIASKEEVDEVLTRFRESAVVPLMYGGGLYALPESQTFPLMFLRTDVLSQLGIHEPPETWEDIIRILPVLQKKNMTFLMDTGTSVGADISVGMNTFAMFLLQRGGQFYKNDGAQSDLDSETAIGAFKFWTRFYSNYGLPTNFNIANRFRTGESPIVISDLTLYNQINVSAPEIKGLWSISKVPGTQGENGIDHSVRSSVSACMIFSTSDHKLEAWDFIKWWTSSETQQSFSRGMESLLGVSARFPTANIDALSKLPWSNCDFKVISEQADWAKGVPEVPGGYYTPRHLNNAFRSATIETPGQEVKEPREALLDYISTINSELSEKRKEFGLE